MSGWLFKKKSITMRGDMTVKYTWYFVNVTISAKILLLIFTSFLGGWEFDCYSDVALKLITAYCVM